MATCRHEVDTIIADADAHPGDSLQGVVVDLARALADRIDQLEVAAAGIIEKLESDG